MGAVQHELCGRERLIVAARQLFGAQGFHQTPMSELATCADVSVGQIYRHFAGKSDLILAIVEEDAGARVADVAALRDKARAGELPLEEALAQLVMHPMSNGEEALSFEMLAEGLRNTEVGASIGGVCNLYREIIRDFAQIANPHLADDELDGAEEMMMALIFGLGHRGISKPRLSPEEAARRAARMLVAALRSDCPEIEG